jgi:hypothetical protein
MGGTEADAVSVLPPSCANAATLMMAIPSGLNPILATNLPLSLSAPRGENLAVDALRLSLLGVGAIHQAFLIAKQGQKSLSHTSSMLDRARTLREAAQMMLEAASDNPETAEHDACMAAGATCALLDVRLISVCQCPTLISGH